MEFLLGLVSELVLARIPIALLNDRLKQEHPNAHLDLDEDTIIRAYGS